MPESAGDPVVDLGALAGLAPTLASAFVSVVGGRRWGLIAAHHHRPPQLGAALRAAAGLLAEVMTTRLAAIQNYAHAHVALMVRRLEQRWVVATSTEGDWRQALLRHPPTLLQPLEASGAVLFHDGEVLTCGDVPATPELRALRDWVHASGAGTGGAAAADAPAAAGAAAVPAMPVEPAAPASPAADGRRRRLGARRRALRLGRGRARQPGAGGADTAGQRRARGSRLAADRPNWLMELREEQLLNVTWSGDPNKPMVVDSSLELSTRRSFAAWSELVRGTARPWNPTELALARAIGRALVDIIVQVHGVRLLIGEQQLRRTRATIAGARQPVLVGQADGRPLLAHAAFVQLAGAARDGRPLALVLTEHREAERAGAARARLAQAIACASVARADLRRDEGDDPLMRAILTRARLAAMDIAEASDDAPMAPVLAEVTAATRRAARLLGWMRSASD